MPLKLRLNDNLWFEKVDGGFSTQGQEVSNNSESIMTKIRELKESGLSVRAIAEKITEEGHSIGKTKVSELLKTGS